MVVVVDGVADSGVVDGAVVAVDVVAPETEGTVVGAESVAALAHPSITAHMAMTDHRASVAGPLAGDLPLRSVMHFDRRAIGVTMIALTILAAGCKVDEGSSTPDTLAPLGTPSNTVPPSTVTTLPPTTDQAVTATSTIALPAGACVFAAAPPTSEVTFEVGTRLYTVNPANGTTSCLTELTLDNIGPLKWSPAGDRVLLNSVTVFDGTQALPTGYFSTNTGVSWSYPTGKALIAPAVADNHLLWRTAGRPETRTDISFLDRTDVAAYHPAGRNIFAAGQAADGTTGLFIASNRGENPQLIAQTEQPDTTITEIGPDPSGALVYFIHDHRNGTYEVHALGLPGLTLTDVTQAAEPIARLAVSGAHTAIAWRLGDCAGQTRTQIANGTSVIDQPTAFAALSTEPVGWLDSTQLVLSVRPTGCAGPSDLWIWNIANSAATPLIAGVDNVAIRSVLSSFGELPNDINQAAPG